MEYSVKNDLLTLTAQTHGGLLHAVTKADGQELLWGGDPAVWPSRAPVCFPWCGNVQDGWYELDGVRHEAAARHGFARDVDHAFVGRSGDAITFSMDHPGDETWPWPFTLQTVHTLAGRRVQTICAATNRGDVPMPVQLGFHPAFRVPFVAGSALTDYVFRFQSGKVIPLEERLFDNDSFPVDDAGRWCRLEHVPSGRYIQVDTGDFFTTLLWSKPGVPGFVCIEPWDGFVGPGHDLFARPGVSVLAPGESKSWTLSMDFEV